MYENDQFTHRQARLAQKLRKNAHVDDATSLGVTVWVTCAFGAGETFFEVVRDSDFVVKDVTKAIGDDKGIKINLYPEEKL